MTLGEGSMRTLCSGEPLRVNALPSLSPLLHLRLEAQAPFKKLSGSKGVHRAVPDLYRQRLVWPDGKGMEAICGVVNKNRECLN